MKKLLLLFTLLLLFSCNRDKKYPGQWIVQTYKDGFLSTASYIVCDSCQMVSANEINVYTEGRKTVVKGFYITITHFPKVKSDITGTKYYLTKDTIN
jgi:hypothetical protein